jgi:ParB/RepB/Spo0J family partition protein
MTLDLSFKELVDAAGNPNAATGRPLLVAIDCIDEDPDQPRRNFSEQELEELSQSIGEHGVLQPIMLRRSNEDGRYVIVMGARRYRAAQRAGLREMPAFVRDVGLPDRYAQMIENIQRDDLRAPEIAAFIANRLNAGDTQADISRKLGKPRDWVSRYASVQGMPEFLRAKLEGSSIRALYELYQAWRTYPDEIERLCGTQDSFTDAQARQLARDVRAAADRADAQNESPAGPPRSERCDLLPEAARPRAAAKGREAAADDQRPKTRVVSQSAASLAIRVRYQNRAGQLVVDRLATQGSCHAVVLVDGAEQAEEVPVSALTIEEILPG